MRADVHGGPEHTRSNQRPDTLMQDRKPTNQPNLLQRTAAPYIWVTGGCRRQVDGTAGMPSAPELPCVPKQLRFVPRHKVAALQPAARGKRREVGSQLRGQP